MGIEAFAQRLSQICEVCPQQLEMDVRQYFRINKGLTTIFVICNCSRTNHGQNLETKMDGRDFVAKRSVTGSCTGTLDKHFCKATFFNSRSTCREKELLDGCTLRFYREMGHK